jgi:hypothetical protein
MLLLFADIRTDRLTLMVSLRYARLTLLRINRLPASDAEDSFIFMVYFRQNPSSNLQS